MKKVITKLQNGKCGLFIMNLIKNLYWLNQFWIRLNEPVKQINIDIVQIWPEIFWLFLNIYFTDFVHFMEYPINVGMAPIGI